MSDHSIEVVAIDNEIVLRFACNAEVGAPCRRRPQTGDEREFVLADDPDLIDGECWAGEWVDAVGFEDAIMALDNHGNRVVWAIIPVSINYDEGVMVTPACEPDIDNPEVTL